ncbi:hypothetical protein CDL12_26735 [Handroanthus impetiginosus]|uniref:Pentacotripeptide-repeat region of PRORP domain-containing protein n=1 Tax=Handroanthus impetiginosus TaxID=429701 RepID=A0A2G9G628_9LAMI|nr:hypothetical protein CDL12_26735 [Handroanthus impetiginosus]
MLTLRYARQTRAFLPFPSAAADTTAALLFSSLTTTQPCSLSSSYPFLPSSSSNPIPSNGSQFEIHRNDVVDYFREWFLSRKKPLYDRIFEILRTQDEPSLDSALSRFNLRLSESLILDVLKYGKEDVLSCLKFFDWAGRRQGFHHTRVTFNAIFRILSKAKLMSLMLDFLQTYMKKSYVHKVRYYNVLVIGYAVAGKSETALQLFGRMRFLGLDLDAFSYHVLMNSLVEQGHFDVVEIMAKEIRVRGFQDEVTHSIMVKSFCKRKEFERAMEYLRGLMQDDGVQLNGIAVATLVDALCQNNQFERAALLLEEFRRMGLVSMDHAYGVWIRDLVKAGNWDDALKFLKDKQAIEGYVPDVFKYNTLICRLLRENKIEQVYDLLVDMKEREILPDGVTMNAVLCFLCKAGRMDIAMDLYDLRADFGLSVNYMAYNYLINTLLGDVSIDEVYHVLRNSIEQGYLPGQKTLSLVADALCREGRLEKLKDLVLFALDQNIMPSNLTDGKFILTLCRDRRIGEGYLVHRLLNRLNKAPQKHTYMSLINGFTKLCKGDIAAELLIEMQEKGYQVSKKLVRDVIRCICKTDIPESQFLSLLQMQLAHHKSSPPVTYNIFIEGAGLAGKPELARKVYEMMIKNDIQPTLRSDILLLQSYLKSGKLAHALHLFRDCSTRRQKRKLWHTMIVGLCKAKKPELASQILDGMKANMITPSTECYEELIKAYCDLGQYHEAIDLVNDMTQIGRPISSFIGNTFLLHALRTRNVYNAWAYLSHKQNLTPACWMLGHVIGVFSGSVEVSPGDEELEKLIQQCFHMDIYTNNMLLRRLGMNGMDRACKFFGRLCEKGYAPNRWTYDIVAHGLAKDGRTAEARIWIEEMLRKGFDPTVHTKRLIFM